MELKVYLFLQLLLLINCAFSLKQYDINEEGGADEYIGNIVQDLDLPPLTKGESPRQYTIFSNEDKVKIEPNGDLLTRIRLDREKICPDNPPKCVIDVEIGVRQNVFRLKKIQLILGDVNDNVPLFPNNIIEKSISESADVGSTIRLDSAVDPDLQFNSIQRYEISSSPPSGLDSNGISVPYFSLHVIENIDGTKMPELRLTEELDREKIASYQLLLYAMDGGNPEQTGTATVVITVLDSNDNGPVFSEPSYVVSVAENVEAGEIIAQVHATDLDHGRNAKIVYSLPSNVGKQDRAIFGLNSTTGAIILKSKLDYENKTIHHLTVEARDHGSSPASAYATVTVQVEDVNDYRPKIDVKFMDTVDLPPDSPLLADRHPNSELIKENTPIGSTLAFVTVTDRDTGSNGNVSCILRDTNTFKMISVGEQQNRYLIKTKKELDREDNRLHYLEIEAWDFGQPRLFNTKTIVVELVDENDNPPTFAKAKYSFQVSESVKPGRDIATLTAADNDVGPNANITYTARPLKMGVSIPFDISPDAGAVYFKKGSLPLDAENGTKSFTLNVTATDNGVPKLSSSTILEITVVDDNDNSPVFTSKNYVFRVQEDSPPGLYVGTVSATDGDIDKTSNGRITYEFESSKPAFSIDANTGEIHFYGTKEDLDRESVYPQPYTFVAIAKDHGEPPRMDHCTVEIYILDINDNPPKVLSPNVTKDIFYVYIKPETKTKTHHLPASFLRSKRNDERPSRFAGLSSGNQTALKRTNRRKAALKNSLLIGSSKSEKVHSPYSVPVSITKVEVIDPDDGENGRVHFTITEGNIHDYFKIDVYSGNITLNIQDEKSLRAMERGCHVIKINVKDLGKPVQHSFGWANIYITDKNPKKINATQAMRDCMNNSFYPKQFLPPKNVHTAALTVLEIIIIGGALAMLLLLCIVVCVLRKYKCRCCTQEAKSYSCKTSNTYVDTKLYHETNRSETPLHHNPAGNSTTYYTEWNHSQGKEDMTQADASEGSIRSRNSTKDSGTGDSMPSDAYHLTGVALQRPHILNPTYQRIQPSHVNIPPQDDIMTTDEEGRHFYQPRPINMIGPKCTIECQQFGHGDHCWLPDSLPRAQSRMTPSRGVEDYDENSLKYSKRSRTPSSYHRVDNGRYANVQPGYYESGAHIAPTISTSIHNGGLTSDNGNYSHQASHGGVPGHGYQKNPYYGQVVQENYRQSPIPSYDVAASQVGIPSTRGQPYMNLQGVTFAKNDSRDDFSNSDPGNQHSNFYPSYPQKYLTPEQQFSVDQPDSYPTYVGNNEQGYYDDHYAYNHQNPYPNEFAATSLLLSPADSEPPSEMQKQEYRRQMKQQQHTHPNDYEYGSSVEIENQHLLKADNSAKVNDADTPSSKLGTIREEIDAAEVVAGIDRLLQ